MSSSPIDIDSTLDTIEAMRRQEENGYASSDYLAQIPPSAASPLDTPVDENCRHVMAKWCNEIADFCNYNRETASVAMSCLDRFMATPDGQTVLLDRNLFQLAAMTALYTAVKIHEHEAMDPALVSSLSRGAHSPEAVEAMESRMLNAIQWRVNPPTALAFVRSMLDLVPQHLMGVSERETVMELTKFQVDLAGSDYTYSQAPASSIAFASLLNAMESVTSDGMFFANFEATMAMSIRIDVSGLRNIRMGLYESVNDTESMDMQIHNNGEKLDMEESYSSLGGSIYSSPRSVNA
jgi:hypothetical protein